MFHKAILLWLLLTMCKLYIQVTSIVSHSLFLELVLYTHTHTRILHFRGSSLDFHDLSVTILFTLTPWAFVSLKLPFSTLFVNPSPVLCPLVSAWWARKDTNGFTLSRGAIYRKLGTVCPQSHWRLIKHLI